MIIETNVRNLGTAVRISSLPYPILLVLVYPRKIRVCVDYS